MKINTWHDKVYCAVAEYQLEQNVDGVAAGLVTQDFEGDQDEYFSARTHEGREAYACKRG